MLVLGRVFVRGLPAVAAGNGCEKIHTCTCTVGKHVWGDSQPC